MVSVSVTLVISWTRVSHHRSTDPQGRQDRSLHHCPVHIQPGLELEKRILYWPNIRTALVITLDSGHTCSSIPYELCPHNQMAGTSQTRSLSHFVTKVVDTESRWLPLLFRLLPPPDTTRQSGTESGLWSQVHLAVSPAPAQNLMLDLSEPPFPHVCGRFGRSQVKGGRNEWVAGIRGHIVSPLNKWEPWNPH